MMRAETGMMTLAVVLIMMTLVVGITAFTTRTAVTKQRMMRAEQQYLLAFEAAESGLSYATAQLQRQPSAATTTFTFSSSDSGNPQGRFTVSAQPAEASFIGAGGNTVTYPVSELVAQGIAPDGSTTSEHRLTVVASPIVSQPPSVPLMVAGQLSLAGQAHIAASADAAGPGVALSIWSAASVALPGTFTSCGQQEWQAAGCSQASYSQGMSSGSDILANSNAFPDDLFQATFGLPANQWQQLAVDAQVVADDCTALKPGQTGLVVITGNCQLAVDLGQPATPVLLLVVNGTLNFSGNGQFYGVVFSFHTEPSQSSVISIDGTASIAGALLANHDVAVSSGVLKVRYQPELLNNLGHSSEFLRAWALPGSWRDW